MRQVHVLASAALDQNNIILVHTGDPLAQQHRRSQQRKDACADAVLHQNVRKTISAYNTCQGLKPTAGNCQQGAENIDADVNCSLSAC